jgi:gluconate 2-dehydrogenase alpha chain
VVIVGLGTAGGVAALPLTSAGLNVVGLTAGPRLSAADYSVNESSLSSVRQIKSLDDLPTWRPDATAPATRLTVGRRSPLMLNAVGGTSILYGARSYRLTPWEFRARSATIERYGAAAIPSSSTLVDWPLTYDDLEPFYDRVEHEIGVSGQAGNLAGSTLDGGNIFEGPRRAPFPMGPVRMSGYNHMMTEAARGLGWHPYPTPVAVNSEDYDGRPGCTYCGFCTNNGCYVDAKGSTDVTVIRKAERTGRLKTIPYARALKIEVDREGRAAGVTFVMDCGEFFQPAKAVLLATYTYENVRMLLCSTSSCYPHGLSNNHDQVGRHYTAHMDGETYGLFAGRKLNRWGGPGAGVSVADWCGDNFDHTGVGFIGGAVLSDGSGSAQTLMSLVSVRPPGIPSWGSAWKEWIRENANALGRVSHSSIEVLPDERNFLDLDPGVTDSFGVPVIRITYQWHENELRCADFMATREAEWLRAAGATNLWRTTGSAGQLSLHAYGGTRMGADPDISVVDRYGFSHEVPNLAVLGASCMPTSGSYNPALTVQALAWWSAEHLVQQWGSIVA